jgi:uncharacterized membrane protein YfcA
MNGPPVVLTMQGLALPPRPFRATLQVVFLGQDLAAVLGFAVLGHLDPTVAICAAAGGIGVPAGWWAGDRLFTRIPAQWFRRLVLVTVATTAVVSLATAVS